MFTNSQAKYLLRESFGVFWRMKGMTAISTVIMSVALMMLAMFTLLTVNMRNVAESFRSEIEVDVFVKPDAPEADVQLLRQRLERMDGVEKVAFVSKEDALQEFRQQLGTDSDLLDVLEENPLPASMRLSMQEAHRTSEKLTMLAGYIREQAEVDEVRYGDQWVSRLEQYIKVFTALTAIIGAVVLLSALFVISNTVRLTVMARSRTIEVMRLVGASNGFIRMPFVIEGAVQGALAGGLAMAVLYTAHHYAVRYVHQLVFYDTAQIIGFIALCATVCVLGAVGSLGRFLRL